MIPQHVDIHWQIQGSARDVPPASNFFPIFMQFWVKLGKIISWRSHLYGWRPLLWEILDPPLIFNAVKSLATGLQRMIHSSCAIPLVTASGYDLGTRRARTVEKLCIF